MQQAEELVRTPCISIVLSKATLIDRLVQERLILQSYLDILLIDSFDW